MCGHPEGADCDCDGNQLDALGECEDQVEDADADGICDDGMIMRARLTLVASATAQVSIYECGCADIPEGDMTATEISSTPWACGGDCAGRRRCRWHL